MVVLIIKVPAVSLRPQVLASYINPAGSSSCHGADASSADNRTQNSSALPSVLQELLSQSCLIPAMSSYLRNDSGQTPTLSAALRSSWSCRTFFGFVTRFLSQQVVTNNNRSRRQLHCTHTSTSVLFYSLFLQKCRVLLVAYFVGWPVVVFPGQELVGHLTVLVFDNFFLNFFSSSQLWGYCHQIWWKSQQTGRTHL